MNRIDEIREERKRREAVLRRARRRDALSIAISVLAIIAIAALLGAGFGLVFFGCRPYAKAEVKGAEVSPRTEVGGDVGSASAEVDAASSQESGQGGEASGRSSVRNVSFQSSGAMWCAVIVALMTTGGWVKSRSERKQAEQLVKLYDEASRRMVQSIEDVSSGCAEVARVKRAVRERGGDAPGELIHRIVRQETGA